MSWTERAESIRAHRPAAYAIGIALPLLALLGRLWLGSSLTGSPFLGFFLAIALVGFFAGLGPGVVAAILSATFAKYYFMEPIHSWELTWPAGWLSILFFALASGTIIALENALIVSLAKQRAYAKAVEQLNASLEERVDQRTTALRAEISQRNLAEAQVRQLQKMEAVGQLTGGIAHDFNNMLAVVISSLEMSKRRLAGGDEKTALAFIESGIEAARRAADLTSRLLAFSRQQALEPKVIDANQLLGSLSELVRRTIGESVQVEMVRGGGLWRTFADPSQIESAVLNLAVNARDAMPDGGQLTIETANADLDEAYASAHTEIAAGQYVMIAVTDTGVGMPASVIEKAFEPFFTTKQVGKGTGLGLSQVFGFVKQSGGHIKIYSELSQGTTVKIYLPRHHGMIEAERAPGLAGEEIPLGNKDTVILVVEDDVHVRQMSLSLLRDLGYGVIEAAGYLDALDAARGNAQIDMLFTDIVMAGMNGRELADRIQALRPGLKALYTTGYTRNAVVHNGVLDAGVSLISKPFTREQLARKVFEMLKA